MNEKWSTMCLGEVCGFQGGSQPPKSTFINEPKPGYVRFLQIRDFDSEKYVTFIPESSKNRICQTDDILLGRYGASVGKVLTGMAGAYNVALMKVVPDQKVLDKRFFFFYLTSQRFQVPLFRLGGRAAQAGFNKKDLSEFEISFPSIPEQRRIVVILDEAFGAIEKAKENAERNLANAKELFDSYLDRVFTRQGEGWEEATLESLVEDGSPITYGVVKPGPEGSVPFIRGGDLRNGEILSSQLRTITEEFSQQYKRTLLKGGELLVCLVGQPGQVGVVPGSLASANIARQVGLVRLRDDVDTRFVSYFLLSPPGKAGLGGYTGGSVQQVINLRDLKKVCIPLPASQDEQARLSAKIRNVGKGTEQLASVAKAKLSALDELKQSILQKAFTGQLTAKSPELELRG